MDLKRAAAELAKGRALTLSSITDGFDAFCAADLTRALAPEAESRSVVLVHVARDSRRARAFAAALAFAAPDIELLDFPSWDCQPYDRVSPNTGVSAKRILVLSRLAMSRSSRERPRILSTTVHALLQRVAPISTVAGDTFSAAPGNMVSMDELARWLESNGFVRASSVRDTGEYAVRGGILDLFAPGMGQPVRLDFFGDTLESIRAFDPESQRTTGQLRSLDLVPMSEVQLKTETIRRFRQAYVAQFGAQTRGDALYEAVSEGRRYQGLEHWLPLFYEKLDSIFDYCSGAPLIFDPLVEEAVKERHDQIEDYFAARKSAYEADAVHAAYKPLPPEALYLKPTEWLARIDAAGLIRKTPFALPAAENDGLVVDCGSKPGHSFAKERADPSANVFAAANDHVKALQAQGKRVILACWSDGSRERLAHVLADHGLAFLAPISSLVQARSLPSGCAALAVIEIEQGFEAQDVAVIAEQDILGDRLLQPRRKSRRAEDFLTEVGSLTAGDLVVHVDHGIGRFVGLKAIEVAGSPHDCLELHYADGDKLFLPVENIELLSRYGSEETAVELDKLGGVAWQKRKARMRKRILDMAASLIKIAAERETRAAPKLVPPEGLYAEFCAGFPYEETEDQQAAIDAVLEDMASGRPMDRLICGDVGFGKTEVALRAAFTAAIEGSQVAVVVPTTLLARQHTRNFALRFSQLPLKIAQMSRMVPSAELKAARLAAASGEVDIVIGTHAVLSKGVSFKKLGLVIIDEEQHFGVKHKERLKELRAEVHVLTLSATPIPRTLQLALTGVRELSIIATPPVDRLAVRSFISPFDEMIVREALLRERYRGGQSFYVCPRIEDLDEAGAYLRQHVPEVKFIVAHGALPATVLEARMAAFYDGQFDVLLSTAIVESGLDIPTANTLIVHRADMFGLAQLYQLRGRVGRSKVRAYALFTVPANKPLTPQAERRLKVLHSLDSLGAGFELASRDLDIRGAGNLLGDDQSGHIKEVGYELYQEMLREAVEALKAGIEAPAEEAWSPSITLGTPVTIPEDYIADVQLRLGLYRRLAALQSDAEIESFAAEMIDRFGPLPGEVEQLLQLVTIKNLCRKANIEKVEAGPKGVIIAFRDNAFANPQGLVRYIAEQGSFAKVRPDMRIVFVREFETLAARLDGTRRILRELAAIAIKKAA
ncbi:MAG TPA: transcription-repair coupling factor [Methylocella sp.]|nr:transcription-repair coupling factor [Methylocella sp.]